jgi:hypothetical protein
MSNVINTKPEETKRDVELTLDELETVSAGSRKSGGDAASSGREFLRFKFDTVFTTKID